jgi:hypothetical protein
MLFDKVQQNPELFDFYTVVLRYRRTQVLADSVKIDYIHIKEATHIASWEKAKERLAKIKYYIYEELGIPLARKLQDEELNVVAQLTSLDDRGLSFT